MAQELDREGDFQASCTDYGLVNFDSGAVGLNMKFRILSQWDPDAKEFHSWLDYDEHEVEGCFFLIKKKKEDGSPGGLNEKTVESLVEHCGWDADMGSISDKSWKPGDCQINVKRDEYKGKVRYKAAFINGFDSTPGGMGGMASEDVAKLQDQWGSHLRALAGKVRDKAKPAGKPAPPTKKPAPVNSAPKEEIPF